MTPRPRVRPTLRLTCLAAALAWSLAGCGDGRPDARVRHVVLISLDTLRADRLGCYGHERETSPWLDTFADGAWLFTDAHAAATNTAPSHMSMFTGVLPPVHGIYNVELAATSKARPADLPDTLPTLAERLSEAGVTTAAFTDGGYLSSDFDFDRGFELFDPTEDPIDAKVDRVLDWLARPDADDAPSFLFVHTYQVHAPYVPPREHDVWSDPAYDGPLRGRVEALRGDALGGLASSAGFLPAPREATPEDVRFLSDLYDGEVRFLDAEIGRLLAALDAPPWRDTTAVFIVSDHGEAFAEHGRFSHTQLYEPVARVPFLLRVPGRPPARRDDPASGVDVTPTVLDLLGVPLDGPNEGRSLLTPGADERVVVTTNADPTNWRGGIGAIRAGTKVLRHGLAAPWQHFRLPDDPAEQTPLDVGAPEPRALVSYLIDLEAEHAREAAALREDWSPDDDAGLSPSVEERLRALGYVADEPDDDGGG